MPKLIHMLKILFVFFYVYGIYGVFFFKKISEGKTIDDLNNFSNLFFAFITLFRIATMEDWSNLAYDTSLTVNI
jgi:voltage-gated sodium channel